MFSSSDEILSFIKKEGVEFIDVRFTDLPGTQQHFNVPAAGFTQDAFTDGLMFDGSSIRGFAAIHKSDLKLLPDPATAYLDPFRTAKTLNLNFSIVEPRTGEPYGRDPRQVASKAEEYLTSTGIADTVYFGPESVTQDLSARLGEEISFSAVARSWSPVFGRGRPLPCSPLSASWS